MKYVVRNKSLIFSLVITSLLMMLSFQYMLVLSTPENNVFIDNFIKGYRPHFMLVLGGVYGDVDYSDPVKSYEDLSILVFKSIPAEDEDMFRRNITTALSILELSSKDGSYLTVILSRYSPVSFGFQPASEGRSPIFITKYSPLSRNLSIYLEERLGIAEVVELIQTSIDDPFILGGEYEYDYVWIVSNDSSEANFYISLVRDFAENSPQVSMFNRSFMYIAVNYMDLSFKAIDLKGLFDSIYSDIVDFYLSFSLSIDAEPSNGSIVEVYLDQPGETPFTRPPKYNVSITHEGILRNLEFLSRSGGETLFYLSNIFIPILFPVISLFLGVVYRLKGDFNLINRVVLFRGVKKNVAIPITASLIIFSYLVSTVVYTTLSFIFRDLFSSLPILLFTLGVIFATIFLYASRTDSDKFRVSRRLFLSSLIIFLVIAITGVIRVSFADILVTYPFLIPIYLFSTPFFPITLLVIYLFIFSRCEVIVRYVWRGYLNSYPVRLWNSNLYLNYMRLGVFTYALVFIFIGGSLSKVYLDIVGTPGMVYKLGFSRVLALYTVDVFIISLRDIVMLSLPLLYLLYLFNVYRTLKHDEGIMEFRGIRRDTISRFKLKVISSHIISDILASGLGALIFYIFLEGYIGFYYGYASPLEDISYDPPRLMEVFPWRIM